MRPFALVAALLVLAPLAATPSVGSFHDTLVFVPDREVVLVMRGTSFNGLEAPDAPLLEAYLGERVRFTVTVPPTLAETHTFHLHGHPWLVPETGRVFDTWLLRPGETHAFLVVAGGVDRHAGDWMYHCHMDEHTARGMWGIFRVYPFRVGAVPSGPATVDVTLDREGAPLDASLALTLDGAPLDAHVTRVAPGRYQVHAPGLAAAAGQLVVEATGEAGASLARVPWNVPAAAPTLASAGHAH